jgi:hypothetical protein
MQPPPTADFRLLCIKYSLGPHQAFKISMRIYLVYQIAIIIAAIVGQVERYSIRIDAWFGTWICFITIIVTFLWGFYLLIEGKSPTSFTLSLTKSGKFYAWTMMVTGILVISFLSLGLIFLSLAYFANMGNRKENSGDSDFKNMLLTFLIWMVPIGVIPLIHGSYIWKAVDAIPRSIRYFQPGLPPNPHANFPQYVAQEGGYVAQPQYAPQFGHPAAGTAPYEANIV